MHGHGRLFQCHSGVWPIVDRYELPTMETGIQYYVCAGTDGVFDVLTNARVADVLI